MKLRHLDGENLYYAFFHGRRSVFRRQKHLNKINVFPVADGDTGTNLAMTCTRSSKVRHGPARSPR